MRTFRRSFGWPSLAVALALSAPGAAWAQDSWDGPVPARVRHFEGSVTVQRAQAAETDQAFLNLPLADGDRVWTGSDGRLEIELADGSLLWLDAQGTLDVVSLAADDGYQQALLRLWSGSLIGARRDGTGSVRIDLPEASVTLWPDTLARVDAESGRSWLTVLDGRAELSAGGLTEVVAAGQRSYADTGTAPASATVYNTAQQDSFDRWQQERVAALSQTVETSSGGRDYLPREVARYSTDLSPNGSWFYYDDFGAWAWRPYVGVSWAPYRHGRWVYGYGGWSWVSGAPWGWVTSHYGRWHHAPAYGWVWFPGSVYSPAWVSWYVSGSYIGWSPIGYYGRPLLSINLWFDGHRGYGHGYHGYHDYDRHSVSRGTVVAGRGFTGGPDSSWTFVSTRDLGRPDLARATVIDRTAVRRGAVGGSVALQGALRPRDPRTLVVGAGAAPRVAVSRDVVVSPSPRNGTSVVGRPGVTVGRDGAGAPQVARPADAGRSVAVPRPSPVTVLPGSVSRGGQTIAPRPSGGPTVAPAPRPSGASVPRSSSWAIPRMSAPRPSVDVGRPGTVGPVVVPRPGSTAAPRPSFGGPPSTAAPRPSFGGRPSTPAPRPSIGSRPSAPSRPPAPSRSSSSRGTSRSAKPRSGSRSSS